MKKNRLVASLLSLVIMVCALTGMVSADTVYRIQSDDGIDCSPNDPEFDEPYHIGSMICVVPTGGGAFSGGVSFRQSYYNKNDGISTLVIPISYYDMGTFSIMDDTYEGSDSSRCVIDVSAYYQVTEESCDQCSVVGISYLDAIAGQTLIESSDNYCPSGAVTRVYATPSEDYMLDTLFYTYTLSDGTHTASAELKSDDSGSYFEFTMPNAPVSLTVHASQTGHRYTSYVNASGDTVYTDAIILDAASPNSLTNGWYVVAGNVEHADRFDVTGTDVNIILEDGASLNAQRGIGVNYHTDYVNTLNIWGQSGNTGVLTATGGSVSQAGIGGGDYWACGTINIYGGTINATGANNAAGIGGGQIAYGRGHGYNNVTVNIYGGDITAKGGSGSYIGRAGAGIGTGFSYQTYDGEVNINITGGNIRATGGSNDAAGIGRGFSQETFLLNITLDCTNNSDISIYADSYTETNSMHRECLVLNGLFMDEDGNTHTGEISDTSLNGKTLTSAPHFTGHSLTLGGDIGVNFFADLSMFTEQQRQNVTVSFTINGVTTTDTYDSAFTNDDGDYGFTCHVTSIQMADMITPVIHYGDNKTIEANPYTVETYYNQILNNRSAYTQNVVNLVEALKNYGSYVQPFLSANARTPWRLGTDHAVITRASEYDLSAVNELEAALSENGNYIPTVSEHDGVTLSYSLILETTTTLRLYLDPGAGGFAGPISVTVNGEDAGYAIQSDGRYTVDITGITALNLDRGNNIVFTYGNQSITVSNLSALSYVRLVIDRTNNFHNEDSARLAMYSLYQYSQAAENY